MRALGTFLVMVDGAPIQFVRKTQRRPISLLKAIIALGGRHVPFDVLADTLWPDSDGDRAHQALTVAIHRLRKLLGGREAVRLREGFVSLNESECWVDVWSFERLCHAALNAKDEETLRKLGSRALDLCRGPFLPDDVDWPWAAPLREKLRLRLRHLATRLAEHGDADVPEYVLR